MPEVKLTEIRASDFDVVTTLNSGQVFHWQKTGDGFFGAIGDQPVYLEQDGEILHAPSGSVELIRKYFALDHPLADICAAFPDDPVMNAARSYCRGLRIIRQPKWECLATFICSSMKQVAHIRQISLALRERFGEARKIGGCIAQTFPSAHRLAESSEQELRECALGYRAKNLLATAKLASSGEADLEAWAVLPDLDLRTRLCGLPGVGAKIANCVMLFAYERLRAFPVDVWIERVLKQQYFSRRRNVTATQLRRFSETYFGDHGGYAQQYLFHHARTASRKPGVVRDSSTALRSARNDNKGDARTASRKSTAPRDSSAALNRPAAAPALSPRPT